ncbi:MAG TPA: bacterial proteasome activator family protein [Acidimicrobiales bacterium]|nr:bacterial proteasome activator family protein [Acidimicrobiales bacterium]
MTDHADLPSSRRPEPVTGDGAPPLEPAAPGGADASGAEEVEVAATENVEQPAKVMRIGSMIKHLLDEVRQAPLDEASRGRLKSIYETSVKELSQGLSGDLQSELERLTLPLEGPTPSDAELRIAQAQLVGWLEGLFHGIQAALFAQQMAARAQLEEMMQQRGLPAAGPRSEPGGAYL